MNSTGSRRRFEKDSHWSGSFSASAWTVRLHTALVRIPYSQIGVDVPYEELIYDTEIDQNCTGELKVQVGVELELPRVTGVIVVTDTGAYRGA